MFRESILSFGTLLAFNFTTLQTEGNILRQAAIIHSALKVIFKKKHNEEATSKP